MKRNPGLILVVVLAVVLAPASLPGQEKHEKPLTPRFQEGGASELIAADIFDTIVYLPVGINSKGPYSFILDTGNGGPPAQSPKTLATMTGCGIGGESWGVVGRVQAIEIGNVRIENPVVDFSTDQDGALASDKFAGIIGSDILHRFHVIFDYPRQRMFLEKNAEFSRPFEYDMAGMRLVASGDKLDVIKVFHLADKAPAQAAGLLAGDEIQAIDGRRASEFNWETLRSYFQQPGKEVRLDIMRDGKRLTVMLTLRRLV